MTADEFALRLTQVCGVQPGDHVLAAVSGGADSMALLHLLCAVRGRLSLRVSCAHMEHGIRGGASLEDMAFVQTACSALGVPFYGERTDAPALAAQLHTGIEDAARRLRYAFLRETAKRIGAQHIALAHHALDQAETVLMHACRGSDVRGLCAMRAAADGLIRPLLAAEPGELRGYLVSIGASWREDETNHDAAYTRNRLRHHVLPALEQAYPGAARALARLAAAAQRDEAYFSDEIRAREIEMIPLADGTAILRSALEPLPDALLGRVIARALAAAGVSQNAGAIEDIMSMLRSGGEAVSLSGGAQARLGRTYLCITREEEIAPTPLALSGMTTTPFGAFTVRAALPDETGDGIRAQVIPRRVLEGACVTQRQDGDAFVPFGRHHAKKLKRMMIDDGIERALRGSMPVLRGSCGVIWAVGLRPSEVCRASETEEQMMVAFSGFLPYGGRMDEADNKS
ncbi:MAG: tRNA lysidine(34) synthetase TilS [Clostridia bacterium]|nr:tRNA lysidine(34) synthetase TilS [Clostridia bacterium]